MHRSIASVGWSLETAWAMLGEFGRYVNEARGIAAMSLLENVLDGDLSRSILFFGVGRLSHNMVRGRSFT